MTRSNKKSQIQNNPTQTVNQSKSVMAEFKLEEIIKFMPNFDLKIERDIDQFIKNWENLEKSSKISDEIKLILFKSKFTGLARERIYNSKNLSDEYSYTEFKNKIREEFKIHHEFENVQNDFLSMKQLPNDNMEKFIRNFNNAAALYIQSAGFGNDTTANNFFEKIKLTRFLEAVRSDLAFEIRKSAPDSYEKACKLALQLERAFNYAPNEQINYVNATQRNSEVKLLDKITRDYEERMQKLEKEIQHLTLENAYLRKLNESQRDCCEVDKVISSRQETSPLISQSTVQGNMGINPQTPHYSGQTFTNVSQQNFVPSNFQNYSNAPYEAPVLHNLSPQASGYLPPIYEKRVNQSREERTDYRQAVKPKENGKPSPSKNKYPKENKGYKANKQHQGQYYSAERADNRDYRDNKAYNNRNDRDKKSYDNRYDINKTSYDKHKVKKKYQ